MHNQAARKGREKKKFSLFLFLKNNDDECEPIRIERCVLMMLFDMLFFSSIFGFDNWLENFSNNSIHESEMKLS